MSQCKIKQGSPKDFEKMHVNMQFSKAYPFGNPENFNTQTTLENFATNVMMINAHEDVAKSVKINERNYLEISSINRRVTSATNKKKLNDPFASEKALELISVSQKRAMQAGSLFDDVVLADAYGFVFNKLASKIEVNSQGQTVQGSYERKLRKNLNDGALDNVFQAVMIPKEVVREFLGSNNQNLNELFGGINSTTPSEVIPGSLYEYMLENARNGKYKSVEKVVINGNEQFIEVSFDPNAIYSTVNYVLNTLLAVVNQFQKRAVNYGAIEQEDAYSDLFLSTQTLVVSTDRNEGGFIDLLAVSRNGLEAIVIDHKSKTIEVSQSRKTGIVGPINRANRISYGNQIHIYMDGVRYMGAKPVSGMLMPSAFEVPQLTAPMGPGQTMVFKIVSHYHSGNIDADSFSPNLVTYSSALLKPLQDQAASLSDYIIQVSQRARESRATTKSSTMTEESARDLIWDQLRESAIQLEELRRQLSDNHVRAYNQLMYTHDITDYVILSENLQRRANYLIRHQAEFNLKAIEAFEEGETPRGVLNTLTDEFMIIQDQVKEIKLEIEALQNLFNVKEISQYTSGLVDLLSIPNSDLLSTRDLFLSIDSLIRNTILPQLNIDQMNHYLEISNRFLEAIGNNKSGLEVKSILIERNKFSGVDYKSNDRLFNFMDILEGALEDHVTELQSMYEAVLKANNDMVMALIPKSYKSYGANDSEPGRVTVPKLNFWEQNLTNPDLISNPLFEIMIHLKNRNNQRGQRLYEERIKSFTKAHNAFRKYAEDSGLSYKQATFKLINRQTGLLYSRYNQQFTADRNLALSTNDFSWMRENHYIVNEKEWFEDYQFRLESFINNLDARINDPENTPEETERLLETRDESIEQFEINNNFYYASAKNESLAWVNKYNLKYLDVKPEVVEQFATEEYKEILKSEPLKDMYDEFFNLAKDARNVYSYGSAYIPDNFFPNFEANLSEMALNNGNIFQTFGHTMDMFLDDIRIAPLDETLGVYDDRFGKSTIPFPGVMPLVDHEGSIYSPQNKDALTRNADKKSYDLAKVGHSFIASLFTFAQYQYTEPMVLALNMFAKSDSYAEVRENRGIIARTPVGQKRTTVGSELSKPSQVLFERFLNYFWYGVRYKDLKEGNAFDYIFSQGDPSKGKGPITFQSSLGWAKAMYSRNVLGLAFVSGTAAGLAGLSSLFINSVENRYITSKSFGQAFKRFLTYRADRVHAKKMINLAMYFNAGSMNYSSYYAMKNTRMENKILSDYMLYGALRTPDMVIGQIITDAVLNSWGLMPSYKNGVINPDKTSWNIAKLEDIPEAYRKPLADYFSFDEENNVIADNTAITEKQVSQTYDIIAQITADTYGQLPENVKMGAQLTILGTMLTTFSTWMPAIINKRFGRVKVRDIGNPDANFVVGGRYRSVIGLLMQDDFELDGKDLKVRENVDPNNMLENRKLMFSNMLRNTMDLIKHLLFFAAFSKNAQDNLRRLKGNFIKWANANPHEYGKLGHRPGMTQEEIFEFRYEKWLKNEIQNLKSAAVELYVTTGILMVLGALRADWDGDDEPDYKKVWALRMFNKTITKTHNELIFMLNPTEVEMFLKQPLPITGLLSDVLQTVANTFDETRDVLAGENSNNDKTPWGYYSGNFIVGFRQLRRVIEPFAQDELRGLQ